MWEGGDPACGHKAAARQGATGDRATRQSHTLDGNVDFFRETCGKCGARRIDRQIGLEASVEDYVAALVAVFREVRRVLRDDGVVFCNLGDSYATKPVGSFNGGGFTDGANRDMSGVATSGAIDKVAASGLKPKDLIGVPWKVAFALQADGWYLRSDIIWAKPNPMPESVRDRPTKSHEYLFLLTKRPRYYWDAEAVKEPSTGVGGGGFSRSYAENQPAHGAMRLERPADTGSRNIRSVWTIATAPFKGAHFATFPPALVEPCVKAGTSEKGCCSALVKRLRIRPDLTDEQRAMVYARLGAKALV